MLGEIWRHFGQCSGADVDGVFLRDKEGIRNKMPAGRGGVRAVKRGAKGARGRA